MARFRHHVLPLLAATCLLGIGSKPPFIRTVRALPLLPDLVVNSGRLSVDRDIIWRKFLPGDCALTEGCVKAAGSRRLLRFTVAVINAGTADLRVGAPWNRPDLFIYSPCHKHYHFSGFANYTLYNKTKKGLFVAVTGHKQAFCLTDSEPFWPGFPGRGYNCNFQGISRGWQDVYARTVDCQWLDITGLASGNYLLEVAVNPFRVLPESSYLNNVVRVPVFVPPG